MSAPPGLLVGLWPTSTAPGGRRGRTSGAALAYQYDRRRSAPLETSSKFRPGRATSRATLAY
eukprot:2550195-Pyramimonas_sp.AAC.1